MPSTNISQPDDDALTIACDSSTPWVAASEGNVTLLQYSIKQMRVSIDATDENGYTLWHAAASYNQISVLEWLWSQIKKDGVYSLVNAVDCEGDSALHYAGDLSAAKFLIEHANIDVSIRNAEGKTALDAKEEELAEMRLEEDYEEDETDVVALKEVIDYISLRST